MSDAAVRARMDWLDSLKIGDAVQLVTPCGAHTAQVEDIRDDRLWVLWPHGLGGELGYSATWVYATSGSQHNGNVRIERMGHE